MSASLNTGAGLAQPLQCLTIDWKTGVRSSAEEKGFSSTLCVLTSSEAHPASYPIGTGGKGQLGRDADNSPHLVPRSRISELNVLSP
jgi:hypothetical protein